MSRQTLLMLAVWGLFSFIVEVLLGRAFIQSFGRSYLALSIVLAAITPVLAKFMERPESTEKLTPAIMPSYEAAAQEDVTKTVMEGVSEAEQKEPPSPPPEPPMTPPAEAPGTLPPETLMTPPVMPLPSPPAATQTPPESSMTPPLTTLTTTPATESEKPQTDRVDEIVQSEGLNDSEARIFRAIARLIDQGGIKVRRKLKATGGTEFTIRGLDIEETIYLEGMGVEVPADELAAHPARPPEETIPPPPTSPAPTPSPPPTPPEMEAQPLVRLAEPAIQEVAQPAAEEPVMIEPGPSEVEEAKPAEEPVMEVPGSPGVEEARPADVSNEEVPTPPESLASVFGEMEAEFARVSELMKTERGYKESMVNSMMSLQTAVDTPIAFSAKSLGEKYSGASRAFVGPGGMVLVDWPEGKRTSVPLGELSSDQVLLIFKELIPRVNKALSASSGARPPAGE